MRRRAAAAAIACALVAGACSDTSTDAEPADPSDEGADDAPAANEQRTGDSDTGVAGDAAPTAGEDDPATPAPATTASDPAATGTALRFATPDGQELAGTLYGDGPIGVVLAHMRGRDQGTWAAFAAAAADAGNRVLTFDFRGYGQSTGTRDTELATDMAAAIELLRTQGVERIVVIGASMGGTAAVNVAAQVDLAGVVSLSAPGNFIGLEATGVAGDVGEPLLLIAAEDDAPYADDARAMADAAPSSILQILPGASHGTNLFADHGDALTTLLIDFIADRAA